MKYNNGPYEVNINDQDGSIKVKNRDWLSKYSAAIYNDFHHVFEFVRKNTDGSIEAISDIDKIYTGEVIYHLPTRVELNPPKLSDVEKLRIALITLKHDYNLNGQKERILSDMLSTGSDAANAAEAAEIAAVLAEDTLLGSFSAAIAEAGSFFGALLTPLTGLLELVKNNEEPKRQYGMRAAAYTFTAWAFDDNVPRSSSQILHRLLRPVLPENRPKEERDFNEVWLKVKDATLVNIHKEMVARQETKQQYQNFLKRVGNGDRKKLCLAILKGFEQSMTNIHYKRVWTSNYSVQYPN